MHTRHPLQPLLQVDKVLQDVDTNNDSLIDYTEFITTVMKVEGRGVNVT